MNNSSADLSAFNGVGKNNALQTQEEEEATEDIRRRQEELQVLIKNVLDEYDYEESTFDSTANVSLDEAQNANLNFDKQNVSEEPQIHALYQARVKEVRALNEELQNVKARLEEETKLNANKQALANSELQQCKISLQQSQELLVHKNSELAEYQLQLQEATNAIEHLQTDLNKLKDENCALRSCNEDLQSKLLQMEQDSAFSTNKITERELQMQYMEQISFLEHQVNEWKRCVKEMEDNNIAVVHQLESTIREKTDKLAEQNKYITDLQTSLEQVRNQSHLYMDMLEKTRTEYSKYKAESKGARELLELIKAGKLGQFADISSSISSMKQKLYEKDKEIKAVKKSWKTHDTTDSHIAADSYSINSNDIMASDSSLKHSMLISEDSRAKIDTLSKKIDELSAVLKDKEKELFEAHEKIQFLTSELERNKETFRKINDKTKLKNDKLCLLVNKLNDEKTASSNEKEKLMCKVAENENDIAELRERIVQERERNENVVSLLHATNRCVQEVARQLGELEETAKEAKKHITPSRERINVDTQTDKIPVKPQEGPTLLQRELELREQMQEDFKRKLDNIESKYKAANSQKFNYDELKQQVLRLTAKLHKYKSLYDASRKAMMEYLMVSSEQVKFLEKKILDIDQQRTLEKAQLEEYKQKFINTNGELAKFSQIVKLQAKVIAMSWKQTKRICEGVTVVRDKTKEITSNGDQKVKEIEAEYRRRQKELKHGVPK